jgi:hypothetical protein
MFLVIPSEVGSQARTRLQPAEGKDAMAKLRCYLRRHRWVQKVQAGEAYYQCRDCGKDRLPIKTALPIIWPRQEP